MEIPWEIDKKPWDILEQFIEMIILKEIFFWVDQFVFFMIEHFFF